MSQLATAIAPCPHCGVEVEGPPGTFCCSGCELAAQMIANAGLQDHYVDREGWSPKPAPLPGADWESLVEHHPDGTCSAVIGVDGMRCASCVWVTEKTLQRNGGVREATVSYGTQRARLTWDSEQTNLSDLVHQIAALGYRPRPLHIAESGDRDLLVRLGVALFAAANVMSLSMSLYAGWWNGMEDKYGVLFRWISLVLATPVAIWSAAPFFNAAWTGLKHRVLHMDLPVSIAVALVYGHGIWATLNHQDSYLDSLTMLVALLLIGRVLEARARHRATSAATSLAARLPRTARRLVQGSIEEVPTASIQVGDLIQVGLGEEIPVDGLLIRGEARVRMALLTGESEPATLGKGDLLVAGGVIDEGSVVLSATHTGESRMANRISAALAGVPTRAASPSVTDKLAPWFTGVTLLIAALTGVGWWLATDLDTALARTIAVLVVACPCALSLAHPLITTSALGAAAKRGLLLRSSDALLDLADITEAAIDKTGTLTEGVPAVIDVDNPVLRVAAALERHSIHPVARAVVAEAIHRGIALAEATHVCETAGVGMVGVVDGAKYSLARGSEPGTLELTSETGVNGRILLLDRARPDASDVLKDFRDLNIEVTLLTGDRKEVAERIGDQIGATHILAEVDPLEKAAWVADHQRRGGRVLFVGDGVNDGPAMANAHVGIALAEGAQSTVQVADGVLSAQQVRPLAAGIRIARIAKRTIRTNLWRAGLYNVLAVTAAVAGWVNPLVAAVLMPISSVAVAWSAWRLEAKIP